MQCNVNQTLTTTAASSLFMASQIGNVNTVKVLIEAGGNVNQATTNGWCFIAFYCMASQIVNTVKVLIEAGGTRNVNQATTTE